MQKEERHVSVSVNGMDHSWLMAFGSNNEVVNNEINLWHKSLKWLQENNLMGKISN